MPILVVEAAPPTFPVDMSLVDTRTLDFRRLDGEVLGLSSRSWVAMAGVTGLHMPPRDVVREQVPGMAGSVLREIRELERPVDLPLFLGSDEGHQAHLRQLSLLQEFLDDTSVDYAAQNGTFDLVVNSASGERYLRCVYVEGMEGSEGVDSGVWWASYGLRLLAVDPYWHGEAWSTGTVLPPDPVGYLSAADGSYTTSWPGALTSSQAIGPATPVHVGGGVPSWSVIEATGPAAAFRARTASGLDVSIPAGLADGESVRIVTDPRQRDVTFDGVRDWSRVAAGDRWEPLPPGDTTVALTVSGVGPGTAAVMHGESLFKRAW